ncbi:hypothetical protein [Nocardiopsis sp. SBT366]|uniref:hypothetical protein n=1 Tax=Nocardiopsis sp. SBT366 TaxID=1580529 RepID=UPI00066BE35A|nr:hypothetical protein [Nocardiopsis sp. SBT366]
MTTFAPGTTVLAPSTRPIEGAVTMRRARVATHITAPGRAPGYLVVFEDGQRRHVTAGQVLDAPAPYPTDSHLHGVALRAATRTSRVPGRVSAMVRAVAATGQEQHERTYTSDPGQTELRRLILGRAAHRLATALEYTQQAINEPELTEHLNDLDQIGVNHRACAYDLSQEALSLSMVAEDVLALVKKRTEIATTMNTYLESHAHED